MVQEMASDFVMAQRCVWVALCMAYTRFIQKHHPYVEVLIYMEKWVRGSHNGSRDYLRLCNGSALCMSCPAHGIYMAYVWKSVYTHIYIYMCVSMHTYIYIYLCTHIYIYAQGVRMVYVCQGDSREATMGQEMVFRLWFSAVYELYILCIYIYIYVYVFTDPSTHIHIHLYMCVYLAPTRQIYTSPFRMRDHNNFE